MEQVKSQLVALWAKVVENKQTVIKVVGTVAGALIGTAVVALIQNREDLSHYSFDEEMVDQNGDIQIIE